MIAVIDYGVGNLFSLVSSLRALGAEATVTSDPAVIRSADRLILPGVGAFADAAAKLRQTGLHDLIRAEAVSGKELLGICLGMQVAVIEFARDVCGMEDADSREFKPNGKHLVIDLMEEQLAVLRKGGTMRLGSYPCQIVPGTMLEKSYGQDLIHERHRHRFEFNNAYRDVLTEQGLTVSGTSPDNAIVEAVEVSANRFHVGVQFHPEFKSRPNKPHPLFAEFIRASLEEC